VQTNCQKTAVGLPKTVQVLGGTHHILTPRRGHDSRLSSLVNSQRKSLVNFPRAPTTRRFVIATKACKQLPLAIWFLLIYLPVAIHIAKHARRRERGVFSHLDERQTTPLCFGELGCLERESHPI
jgi:hypothetical protein